jgi:6-pyruvoyltetrahydropterin/6-carboxytetrahydropterin synthase
MQIAVTVASTFAAAHRLPDHEGRCFRLHGHTYGLEVTVAGTPQQSGPAKGMVMDFADLRRRVDELIVDKVDHQLLNDVFAFVPTVEALGAWMFERLLEAGIPVTKVRLSEGPNSWVEVTA